MRVIYSILFAAVALVSLSSANILTPRAVLDTCANVDATLTIFGIAFGKLKICLCLSALPAFIQANLVTKAAVAVVGTGAVTSALTALINTAPGHQECHYPDHCAPVCAASNPCDFSCTDGYTKSGTACVCASPHIVCNGKCVSGPACPSAVPRKRSLYAYCDRPHQQACGIWANGSDASKRGWECVDVSKDLESCGGCALPLRPSDIPGTDCSAIPNVRDVSCFAGKCKVASCRKGFAVANDGSSCAKKSSVFAAQWQSPPTLY